MHGCGLVRQWSVLYFLRCIQSQSQPLQLDTRLLRRTNEQQLTRPACPCLS
jgi:hypothetical protein